MLTEIASDRLPRVEIWRRGAAFAIDFLGAWIASSLIGGRTLGMQFLQALVFLGVWLGLRVLVVYRNQGQSLGRWALDMKVVDFKLGRVPDLPALVKREGITGLGAILALIGLKGLLATNAGGLLLALPLAVECGMAFSDEKYRQAFHDRQARTVVVQTRRGYSLDLKIKKLLAQAGLSMKR